MKITSLAVTTKKVGLIMHSFAELVDQSTSLSLDAFNRAQEEVAAALQTSAVTPLVKALQMIQLQKVIISVGMFSIFESMIQDALDCRDGFAEARQCLEEEGERDLKRLFSQYAFAINVLKHGRGRSYEALLAEADGLPFRIRRPDENFFFEGDVSEVSTLVEVNDEFVLGCARIISEVSNVLMRARPDAFL